MTFTGTASSSASNGALARNARMNTPFVRAGRIFGAMPPPMNTPPVAMRAKREVAGFRAVGLDEHVQRFGAAAAPAAERSRRKCGRGAGGAEIDRRLHTRPVCVTR